eukprot:2447295-Rhodomonas_salina.6
MSAVLPGVYEQQPALPHALTSLCGVQEIVGSHKSSQINQVMQKRSKVFPDSRSFALSFEVFVERRVGRSV